MTMMTIFLNNLSGWFNNQLQNRRRHPGRRLALLPCLRLWRLMNLHRQRRNFAWECPWARDGWVPYWLSLAACSPGARLRVPLAKTLVGVQGAKPPKALAFCQGLAFNLLKILCYRPHDEEVKRFCELAPPAKDALRSSFASGWLSKCTCKMHMHMHNANASRSWLISHRPC